MFGYNGVYFKKIITCLNVCHNFIESIQISVATVLTNACKTREQQSILAAHGAVRALAGLLASAHADVQLPALKCLAYMVFGNEQVGFNESFFYFEQKKLSTIVVSF